MRNTTLTFVALVTTAIGAFGAEPSAETTERIGDVWSDKRNPIVKIFGGQRLNLWSLKPVQRPVAPEVKSQNWAKNELDRFVLAKLESAGASPTTAADARTLARRLYFDLTGLPPTAQQVQQFAAAVKQQGVDPASAALVDELLHGPRFGEHFARLWLDVVRYSDSNGFDWDEFRPQAWRFRDYVVRSFNADKPFDQFIREHLAGDELLTGTPQNAAEQDCLIATGFLRLGPHDNAAGLFNEQDRSRAELLADMTETTAAAFLGLTFSCCRCHDHKYDPISQADHDRLRAFFAATTFANELPIDLAQEQAAINQHNEKIDAEIKPLKEQRDKLPEKDKEGRKNLLQQIDQLSKQRRKFTHALLMTVSAKSVAATHVLFQGGHKAPREEVVPGFPSLFDPQPATICQPASSSTTGKRLTLANWIASANNPLTARVFVNRIWQQLMGRPLVATPNDFGFGGVRPEDEQLLDWLASEFVRNGWSVKKLVRSIVLSSTYQQAATSRSDHFAHRRLRRLTAEQLRDAVLSVSGLLNAKANGPPVWPDLAADVLHANPAFLDDNAEKTKGWYTTPKPEQFCRSLFLVQKRNTRIPLLESFDLPDNSTPCARREVSTVAPQALMLLNGELTADASRSFAERVEREAGKGRGEQVRFAFELALQRPPEEAEFAACERLFRDRSLVELCRALLNLNEFVYLD